MPNNRSKFYSRQLKLIGVEGQELLNQARVLVIGAGGLGCPVLLYLAAMGVGQIGIVDNDRVDTSNLHRQILYAPHDVGENKAEVAAKKIGAQNPYIEVRAFGAKLNQQNVAELFKNYEIIVDCTDNFETKFLVHDECFYQNKKLVQASIYQYEGNLHVFDFSDSDQFRTAPCLRCLWIKEPEDGCIGTCADVGIIGATAGVLGSLQAMEVSKLILGKESLQSGEGLFVDLISQDYEKRRWKKNSACPLCSNEAKTRPRASSKDFKLSLEQVGEDLIWIDLRSKEEVEANAIEHSGLIHMPLSDFNIAKLDSDKKYLLICQKGYRSHQVARALHDIGHENIFSLIDGILNFSSNQKS